MKTVLVVDDEFGITEVVEDILTDAGYQVLVAGNGRQALDLLEESRPTLPGLILLDFMMPEMNGPAVLNQLAGRPGLAAIPVVVMSSLDPRVVAERCTGYSRYLRKPFTVHQVLDMVAAFFGPP